MSKDYEISDDLLGKVSAGGSNTKGGPIECDGVVVDIISPRYIVEISNGHKVEANLSGKLNMHSVKIGDEVKVEISPYDLTKGRIVYLYK